jgi:hypothetical protein
MTRASTWTNPDGLVVGFGQNFGERQVAGVDLTDGHIVEYKLQITFASTFGSTGAKITVPAGCQVRDVALKVGAAWVGGTSLSFGDATTPAGWITAAQGATANLTAGNTIGGQGVYVTGGTDATAMRFPKPYAAATDLFVTLAGGPYTAGDATITVRVQQNP